MESRSITLQVITDAEGKVLGTQPIVSPEPSLAMEGYSRLVAGPEQERHEVEVQIPEHMLQEGNVIGLHDLVQAKIDQNRSGNY